MFVMIYKCKGSSDDVQNHTYKILIIWLLKHIMLETD